MCGRYTLARQDRIVEVVPNVTVKVDIGAEIGRFNIAPTQQVPIVTADADGKRRLSPAKWGLVPSWADDPKIGNSLLNARAETVAEKPAFRSAFKRHRCLIVTDGFYEWKKDGDAKQPFYMRMTDDRPFAFAGLWERWRGATGPELETVAFITTEANERAAAVHDRMPVILDERTWDGWLDADAEPEELKGLLRPYPSGELLIDPVSTMDPWGRAWPKAG